MQCPYCQTENRDDREACYHCGKDVSMLRLIVNKAKHHYNQALEHAERGRNDEAITELKNALDLDSSMVAAYVVLGTLYAQKEQFAEARQAWEQALKLNHHFDKAHDYLNKSTKADYVFPAIRRLKRISVIMAVLLLVVVGALIGLQVRHARPSGDALAAQLRGKPLDSAEARGDLEKFAKNNSANADSRKLAEELSGQIKRDWQYRLDLAGAALAADSPSLALQIAEELAAKQPGQPEMASIRRVRQIATQQIMDRLQAAAAAFSAGTARFEEIEPIARRAMAALPEGPQRKQVSDLLERLTAEYRQRVLADAGRVFDEAPLAEALQRYGQWKARFPELAEKLNPLLDQRLARETDAAADRLHGFIGQGDLDRGRRELTEMRLTYEGAGRPAPASRLAALQADLNGAAEAQRLAQVHAAFAEKRWEDFLKVTQDLDRLSSDTVERAKLKAQRTQALRNFVQASYDWMEARDTQFELGSISSDDAAKMLRIYPQVLENLPKSLKYAQAPILFYAASSHLRLGQAAQAKELLARIKKDYPKSYILKSAAKFEKRYAEKLK
jgi:tetratricopeptide (TPR) repeat protein